MVAPSLGDASAANEAAGHRGISAISAVFFRAGQPKAPETVT